MGEDFSWDDIEVVTIQDRTEVIGRMVTDESSASTSESDVEEWHLQMEELSSNHGDNDLLTLDDLPEDGSELEVARAQLAALALRRERIREIAARYSGPDGPDAKRAAEAPMLGGTKQTEKVWADGPVKPHIKEGSSTIESILQRSRREGLGGDMKKIQEGMERDQQRSVELWHNFLCDDMPVGGDVLPSPDDFYRSR
ncbi:unnamed protein product [Durusdinium trenchii]|uniref:Uncharacterized protein n=2 Tax=Durusdinium trenchii TaxID=1381693 RepID=A0ABP0NCW7_9DINO